MATGVWGRRADFPALETSSDCDEQLLRAIASDGNVGVYSLLVLAGPSDDPCGVPVTKSGGVYLTMSKRRMRGVPPAVALAVSGDLLAVVPVDADPQRRALRAAANGPVEVYDVSGEALRATANPVGTAIGVAISPDVLALLVRDQATMKIEWFDPRSGRTLGERTVPSAVDTRISAAGRLVVYRVGRKIFVVNTGRRRSSLVATATATPIGLSIEAHRVAWAENVSGRGRIMTLQLPDQ